MPRQPSTGRDRARTPTYDETYRRARARARRRPTWWLRRRERRILARHPGPPGPQPGELAELAAVRRELQARTGGRWPA